MTFAQNGARAVLLGCLCFAPGSAPPAVAPVEVTVQILHLGSGLDDPDAEMSGLAWYGDQLVLLPQFPARFPSEAGGSLFAVDKSALIAHVAHPNGSPLELRAVPFSAPGIETTVRGFEGFEAIAFQGDEVFLTVEGAADQGTMGYLLKGHVTPGLGRIDVDLDHLVLLDPQTSIGNLSYEAIMVAHDRVLAFYEANGVTNPHPLAHVCDRSLGNQDTVPLERVEYRITDVTELDAEGRFWATNYYFDGDTWPTGVCAITERYGRGATQTGTRTVERLIELQLTPTGIIVTDRPPILLRLEGTPRNWEGIVRLDDLGFILVTDTYPRSELGFVPLS